MTPILVHKTSTPKLTNQPTPNHRFAEEANSKSELEPKKKCRHREIRAWALIAYGGFCGFVRRRRSPWFCSHDLSAHGYHLDNGGQGYGIPHR